ncbi:MAG: integrase [Ideonella sp.]|nr:integrase [Ideonella sp.]
MTYYFYDRRPEGLPDLPLGKGYDQALAKWDEIHNQAPRIAGTLEEAFAAWESRVLPTYESAETRRGYAKNLRRLRPVFGTATWDGVLLRDLRAYLEAREGKTQANREMSLLSLVWNWARVEGYTDLPWPAAGMARARWKNPEKARKYRPADDVFAAVYAQADQVLRDCMDLASATGMRLTDCRTVLLPRGDLLHLEASKTGKEADFDLSLSAVLPDLIARRRATKARHLMLLTTPDGRPVSARMLRDRYDAARALAVAAAREAGDEALAARVQAMWLRDMRKLASVKAGSLAAAADLLQHDDPRLTARHYPSTVRVLKPAR